MRPEQRKELQSKSKPAYATFLKGDGGQDLIIWYEQEKNNLLLKAMAATTHEEKASCVDEISGLTKMRDYFIRQSKDAPSKGGATSTRRSASKGRKS